MAGPNSSKVRAVKIKAVILDYGEVLSYPPTGEEWGRMASLFNLDPGVFRQLWGRNRLVYDRGDISYESYWSKLAEDASMKLGPEQSAESWSVGFGNVGSHQFDDGGVGRADSFLRNKDRAALKYAHRDD